MSLDNKIKNPCIHVCTKDENGICLSCYRSKEEIRDWYHSNDEQKQDVLLKAEARRAEFDKNQFYI